MTKFYVVDSIMGSGKSCAAINMVKKGLEAKSKDEMRYIYVTPYLAEVRRIADNCEIWEPENETFPTKTRHAKWLISKGKSFAASHELLHYFDKEMLDCVRKYNYTLIIDESFNVF